MRPSRFTDEPISGMLTFRRARGSPSGRMRECVRENVGLRERRHQPASVTELRNQGPQTTISTPLCERALLTDPHHRDVDHLDIALIRPCDRIHRAIPEAGLARPADG